MGWTSGGLDFGVGVRFITGTTVWVACVLAAASCAFSKRRSFSCSAVNHWEFCCGAVAGVDADALTVGGGVEALGTTGVGATTAATGVAVATGPYMK